MSCEEKYSDARDGNGLLQSSYNSILSEDEVHHDKSCCCHLRHPRARRTRFLCSVNSILWLLASLLSALLIVALSLRFRSRGLKTYGTLSGLDKYSILADYTLTWQLEGDEGSGASTVEAAELWRKILDTSGIVSIPHTWAQQHGLPPSDPHPERPDHGVYQIDLWHSLHCLYRIRNRIASHLPLDAAPRDDKHTLHCIDYIRQQLMCHADTTLQEGLSNRKTANQCKDFNVIQDWVRENGWPGYGAYMAPIMAAEEAAAAAADAPARNHSNTA